MEIAPLNFFVCRYLLNPLLNFTDLVLKLSQRVTDLLNQLLRGSHSIFSFILKELKYGPFKVTDLVLNGPKFFLVLTDLSLDSVNLGDDLILLLALGFYLFQLKVSGVFVNDGLIYSEDVTLHLSQFLCGRINIEANSLYFFFEPTEVLKAPLQVLGLVGERLDGLVPQENRPQKKFLFHRRQVAAIDLLLTYYELCLEF